MASSDQRDIDNRYNPIYQRGGSETAAPDAGSIENSQSASRRAAGRQADDRSAGNQAAGYLPAGSSSAGEVAGSHSVESRPAQPAGDAPEHTGSGRIAEVIPADATAHSPQRTQRFPNPFLIALWIVGVGLIAFGVWLLFAPLNMDQSDPGDFVIAQWVFIAAQSASGLVVGGAMALTAALVLHSLSWERRRN